MSKSGTRMKLECLKSWVTSTNVKWKKKNVQVITAPGIVLPEDYVMKQNSNS